MGLGFKRARLGLASATVVAGLAFSGAAASAASAAQTMRIMYNPNPTNTSIVVAQQQGFFKKNGLNVKLMTSQATAALMPALGKQFDLLTTTPDQRAAGAQPRASSRSSSAVRRSRTRSTRAATSSPPRASPASSS